MLDVHFVILGAAIGAVGQTLYVRDTVRGETQPNRVTWLLWAIVPVMVTAICFNLVGDGLRDAADPFAGE